MDGLVFYTMGRAFKAKDKAKAKTKKFGLEAKTKAKD